MIQEAAALAARSIADQLMLAARWQRGTCTWSTDAAVAAETDSGLLDTASLYSGDAGIALFLGEFHRVFGDAEVHRTARGGIRHALERCARRGLSTGAGNLFRGNLGVAVAAARLAHQFDDESLRRCTIDFVASLAQPTVLDRFDVIRGAAGDVIGHLRVAAELGHEQSLERAREAGLLLVRAARRELCGWSWDCDIADRLRNLTGFAHGSSGAAYALLELAAATGEAQFAEAASQALAYDRQFFSKESGTWRDLRGDPAPSNPHGHGSGGDHAGLRPPPTWCHGAPGILASRLHAISVLSDRAAVEESQACLRHAGTWFEEQLSDCLCHGVAGNLLIVSRAADVLADDELADFARRTAEWMLTRAASCARWRYGTRSGAHEHGLMRGSAGIGITLLRLCQDDVCIPTFTDTCSTHSPAAEQREPCFGSRDATQTFYRRTLRALEITGAPAMPFPVVESPREGLERVEAELDVVVSAMEGRQADIVRCVYSVEKEAARAFAMIDDFSEESRAAESLRSVLPFWPDVRIARPPTTVVYTSKFDWEHWLASSGAFVDGSDADAVNHLLFRRWQRILVTRIDETVALTVHLVTGLVGVRDVVTRAIEAAGVDASERGEAAEIIESVLLELVRAGALVVNR